MVVVYRTIIKSSDLMTLALILLDSFSEKLHFYFDFKCYYRLNIRASCNTIKYLFHVYFGNIILSIFDN